MTTEEFWKCFDHRPDGCWIWTRSYGSTGYGQVWITDSQGNRRKWDVHRLSLTLTQGPIPPGMFACHHCDVRACGNPAHLFKGTRADNMADWVAKGRSGKGSRNSQARLTEAQVLEARARYAAGGVTHRQIAAEYGVSRAVIGDIINHRRWKHL